MRKEGVAFHLAKSDATGSFSPLSERQRGSLMAMDGTAVKGQPMRGSGLTLTGCRVSGSTGPVVRTWNLSLTMCLNR